jgi:Zn-finger nucleic acid-binding protein
MLCPVCNGPLATDTIDGESVERCGLCGGEYCDHRALQAILNAHLPPEGIRPQRYKHPISLSEPVRYRRCPVCDEPMLRRNFRETSGVVVDVCSAHGVWLDRGELGALTEFASTGAMREADRRIRERAEARKRLDSFGENLRAVGPRHYIGGLGHLNASAIPIEALVDLVRTIPGVGPDDDR